MIKASVLEAMLAAGCTADQIVRIVQADEDANAEKLAEKREKNRIRQRNHRARNAMSHVTACDTPFPDKEKSPQTPLKEINPIPDSTSLRSVEAPRKRGCRLPDDWSLPKAWGDWALKEGWPETVIRKEAAQFANYWQSKAGKDATKLDWEKTWRNWMLKAPKKAPASEKHRRRDILDVIDETLEKHDDPFAAYRDITDAAGTAGANPSTDLRLIASTKRP